MNTTKPDADTGHGATQAAGASALPAGQRHRVEASVSPEKRTAHSYEFTFESRRNQSREHIGMYGFNWRSAQSQAITKVAIRTKTPRHVWRMTYMEETR